MKWVMALSTLDAIDGGPPNGVLKTATALANSGHDVTIVSLAVPKRKRHHAIGEAIDAGVCIELVEARRLTPFRFSARYLIRLHRSARNADILSIHGFYQFMSVAGYTVARIRKASLFLQPHGVFEPYQEALGSRLKPLFRRSIGRLILKYTHTVFAASEQEARGIAASVGISPSKISITSLGVDSPSELNEPTRSAIPAALFLSRIAPKKRLDLLIDSLEIIRDKGLEITLDVCGSGEMEYVEGLKSQYRNAGPWIRWHGHVDGEERRRIEQTSWFMCLPTDNENFGQAITEAMSVGLPVITTEAAGAALHVKRAQAGWVLDKPTVTDLARTIESAIADPALLQETGARAHSYAQAELSWNSVAAAWAARAQSARESAHLRGDF